MVSRSTPNFFQPGLRSCSVGGITCGRIGDEPLCRNRKECQIYPSATLFDHVVMDGGRLRAGEELCNKIGGVESWQASRKDSDRCSKPLWYRQLLLLLLSAVLSQCTAGPLLQVHQFLAFCVLLFFLTGLDDRAASVAEPRAFFEQGTHALSAFEVHLLAEAGNLIYARIWK